MGCGGIIARNHVHTPSSYVEVAEVASRLEIVVIVHSTILITSVTCTRSSISYLHHTIICVVSTTMCMVHACSTINSTSTNYYYVKHFLRQIM